MQLSSDVRIPDGLLAANALLSEKPHQGVPSWNLALHQGIDERNSTAAIGLRVGQHLNRAWSRYTGKERDAESGLDYFGARYYASNMGRWTSPDVPFADQNPDNPQSWNLYGYVRNNPLNSIDTNGRVTWLIGGTWHNPKDWTASSPLGQEMSGFFDPNDDDVETIEWSGGNTDSARAELSAKIAAAMAAHSWKPGEQNNIVCHSHGCNGVMGALPTLMTDGFFVNNLVSLGQPMRGDYPYSGGVDTWYNVYAGNDLVQKLGGRVPLFGGRKNSNANNFQVHTGKNPIAAHGALHNDWLTRMQWEMFIRGAQQPDDSGGGGKRNCVDNTCHGIVP